MATFTALRPSVFDTPTHNMGSLSEHLRSLNRESPQQHHFDDSDEELPYFPIPIQSHPPSQQRKKFISASTDSPSETPSPPRLGSPVNNTMEERVNEIIKKNRRHSPGGCTRRKE